MCMVYVLDLLFLVIFFRLGIFDWGFSMSRTFSLLARVFNFCVFVLSVLCI